MEDQQPAIRRAYDESSIATGKLMCGNYPPPNAEEAEFNKPTFIVQRLEYNQWSKSKARSRAVVPTIRLQSNAQCDLLCDTARNGGARILVGSL